MPVYLEYSKKKASNSYFNSSCFSLQLDHYSKKYALGVMSSFQPCPEMKLRVIPAGYADGRGTHLSLQLYLVNSVQQRELELQRQERDRQILGRQHVRERQRHPVFHKVWDFYGQLFHNLMDIQEMEKQTQAAEEKELQDIGITILLKILNQIDDNEHLCVTGDHFCVEGCNVLIFDSPCFVSNEVLYKSTATCQYLHDDNIYFLIEARI